MTAPENDSQPAPEHVVGSIYSVFQNPDLDVHSGVLAIAVPDFDYSDVVPTVAVPIFDAPGESVPADVAAAVAAPELAATAAEGNPPGAAVGPPPNSKEI